MSIYKKLMTIQSELKAPKGQFNDFGKYKYRNLEDILEAAKPMLLSAELTLTLCDEIVMIGDRVYVKATATLTDGETHISNCAFAREALVKKGMDESQITGATSSYARKYCVSGLFLCDDTRDADSNAPLTLDEQIDQCPHLAALVALHETLSNNDKENNKDKFTKKRESFQ